ncbi:MAG: MBL fold metallo-hydrolase [Alphaproteobacteria bacterium]|nr:MAG: MBL fold metallo-hydrolase [Alphaproteobacteria bacterium]
MRKYLALMALATCLVYPGTIPGSGKAFATGFAKGDETAKQPFRGPLAPDLPLAGGYDGAAKALAQVDDNPIIAWEYRIWCETGYRSPEDAGTGQKVDDAADLRRDYMSPKGFFHSETANRLMPEDGVPFLENAWYFGADGLGVVVVRRPEGLLIFDTMGNRDHFKLVLSQMKAAGLDPKDTRYVFIGHFHQDHTGGVNLIREIAPDVKVVIGAPDAAIIGEARDALRAGKMPEATLPLKAVPFYRKKAKTPEESVRLQEQRLATIPRRFDILVEPDAGVKTGMQVIDVSPATQVYAILAPGHTPGQTWFIVPVEHRGETRQLLVQSGNDMPDEAKQYANSTSFVRAVAGQVGADTIINTHGYQGAMYYHLRQLKADPGGPNPFAMGPDGIDRFLGIFAECQRATYNRLKDGTWQAF